MTSILRTFKNGLTACAVHDQPPDYLPPMRCGRILLRIEGFTVWSHSRSVFALGMERLGEDIERAMEDCLNRAEMQFGDAAGYDALSVLLVKDLDLAIRKQKEAVELTDSLMKSSRQMFNAFSKAPRATVEP